MKRFSIALAASLALTALVSGGAHAASSATDSTCNFDRRVNYNVSLIPERPCTGQLVSLRIGSCSECDDIVFGYSPSPGDVRLRFDSYAVCPTIPCRDDSLVVPLGFFAPGPQTLAIHVVAVVVGTPGADSCAVFQEDSFSFVVDSCGSPPPPPPPPPILPFVDRVVIGTPTPCLECPPLVCPGQDIPVLIVGTFPDPCHHLRGVDLLPSPLMRPGPAPPVVRLRIAVSDCPPGGCPAVLTPWSARVTLPGLPPGPDYLMVEEMWVDPCDSLGMDSLGTDTTFHANVPFEVAQSCSTTVPTGCWIADWINRTGDPRCDAFLVNERAQLDFRFVPMVPVAGLQGELVFEGRALTIENLEAVGAAAGMRLVWNRTATGARFLLLDVSGHPIPGPPPDSARASGEVLRVTVVKLTDDLLTEPVFLGVRSLIASDPAGNDVPACPTFAPMDLTASICPGSGRCDFNHDGTADVRDLVLMVRCITEPSICPPGASGNLDCNHDGQASIDDVWCCARVVLHGGIPDTAAARPEPSVHVSMGAAIETTAGLDVPVRVSGADRLGAARLVLDYPASSFDVTGVQLEGAAGAWIALHELETSRAIVGLIDLGSDVLAERPGELAFVLHLARKPGAEASGQVRLSDADFSGTDGAALQVYLGPLEVPVGELRSILLSRAQPNPFSGSTQFSVTLPRAAETDIAVYDLNGRRVASVFHGMLPAGSRGFEWNGRGEDGARLGDGVYFLRATGAAGNASRKLVLMRGN